jgi:hypothetical protein
VNDDDMLNAVRESISRLPMRAAPDMGDITARARARRRRRVGGGLSVAGAAAACAALAVGLAGGAPAPGRGYAAPTAHSGSAGRATQPAIKLAAFSVVAGPGGSTELTLNSGQVADPSAVRQALAQHGIPAIVTAGKFCRTAIQPAPGVGDVVVLGGGPDQPAGGPDQPAGVGRPLSGPSWPVGKNQPVPKPTNRPIVIYGSRIPSGVELSIGYRDDPQEHEISFTLIVTNAPLTCTSLPDHGPHPDD